MNKNCKCKYDIKTIVDRANKGCIDDPDEVDEVMSDLLTLPLWRIRDVDANDGMGTFYGPIRESDIIGCIDNQMMGNMSLMDLLVVLDHIPEDRWNEFNDDENDGEGLKKRCFTLLICMMRNYRKYIPEFHRFMFVTIGSFLEYVDRHNRDTYIRYSNDGFRELSYICHRYLDIDVSKDQTISVLFDIFFKTINRAWQPWLSLDRYYDKIMNCYQMMDTLLIKYIRQANPEEMSFGYVSQKYAADYDYYDDESEIWDEDLFDDHQPEDNKNNI